MPTEIKCSCREKKFYPDLQPLAVCPYCGYVWRRFIIRLNKEGNHDR